MDRDLIEDKLYQLINQFNEKNIIHEDFSFALLHNMHPFYDGNGRNGNFNQEIEFQQDQQYNKLKVFKYIFNFPFFSLKCEFK